jgi:hypothetical protein
LKLYLTRCSYRKRKGEYPPDKLYVSRTIAQFVSYCRRNFLSWAILSAKYGLFFPDEQHADYNVTWKSDNKGRCIVLDGCKRLNLTQSAEYNERLAQKISQQAKQRGVSSIVFYAPNPMRTKCYLSILHRAIQGCTEQHGKFSEIAEHVEKMTQIHGSLYYITKLKQEASSKKPFCSS